jgi:hypothetical protein
MKLATVALVVAFMLLAGITLAGAGHGWVAGGIGCFTLAPVCFFAWSNALSRKPSLRIAIATLITGLAICGFVAIVTVSEGTHYLFGYWQTNRAAGIFVAALAYLNWLVMSVLAIFRAKRGLPSGT